MSDGEGTTFHSRFRFAASLTPTNSSHHNVHMASLIFNAGHRIVFRAPYYPVDGPIEYVFNTLQCYLRLNNGSITDGPTLVGAINAGIGNMTTFTPYFTHCGYWRT